MGTERLAETYGQSFAPRVLHLNPGGTHEFDAVSADQSVGRHQVEQRPHQRWKPSDGQGVDLPQRGVYYLTLVSAPTRLLVLTNPHFHAIVTRVTTGAIADGVEVGLVPLPAEMQEEVDRVTKRASREMGRDATLAAAAVVVEEVGEQGEQA